MVVLGALTHNLININMSFHDNKIDKEFYNLHISVYFLPYLLKNVILTS